MAEMVNRFTKSTGPLSQSDGGSSRSRSVGLPTILSGMASSFCSSEGDTAVDTRSARRNDVGSLNEDDDSSDSVTDDGSTEYSLGALRRRLEKLKDSEFDSSESSEAWIDVSDSSSSLESSSESCDDTMDKSSRVRFDEENQSAFAGTTGFDEELTFSSSPTRLRDKRLQRRRQQYTSHTRSLNTSKDPAGRVYDVHEEQSIATVTIGVDDNITLASISRPGNRSMTRTRCQPLNHIRYFPSVEVASIDHDLSTVEPIRVQDARPAFNKRLPREVPLTVLDSDDVSSIGVETKRPKTAPKGSKLDLIDEETGSGATSKATKEGEKQSAKLASSCSSACRTEAFFVLLISLAMIALVVLIAILAKRRN